MAHLLVPNIASYTMKLTLTLDIIWMGNIKIRTQIMTKDNNIYK